VSGVILLDALREVQVPVLGLLLVGACAAKAGRGFSTRSFGMKTGPGVLFPVRLRRPAAIGLCASELVLGTGLLLTAGRAGEGRPALTVRLATALLFCTAVGALLELRERRPDAGCGCFGELSRTPVSWRVITRGALLSAAALAAVGARPLHWPASAAHAGLFLGAAAAEVALLVALSPETGQVLLRLGHRDPCELRDVPVAQTLAALHASAAWRRHQRHLIDARPSDVWREGCWRFAAYPGLVAGRRVDVVFAVYLAGRPATVRVGLLDSEDTRGAKTRLGDPLELSNRL
jgi:hypothetical protein